MIRGMAFLLLFQALGELISRGLGWPVPGNVLGMGLLLAALGLKLVKVDWLEEAGNLLLDNMALFFVPAGVGVMVYSQLIAREWLPITVATIVSTFVVMAVTGKVADALEAREEGQRAEQPD